MLTITPSVFWKLRQPMSALLADHDIPNKKPDRIGTALAFITQISLVGSVQFAYTQCLWRALKRSVISVRGVDAGFDVTSNLLSFTNVEMLSKLRLASFLALIAWSVPDALSGYADAV